jgi:hypothetical protein
MTALTVLVGASGCATLAQSDCLSPSWFAAQTFS